MIAEPPTTPANDTSMFGPLLDRIFPPKAIEIASDFPMETSKTRLRSLIKPLLVLWFAREGIGGRISDRHVYLHHVVPFFGNGMKPVFVGNFAQRGSSIILAGRFTVSTMTKIGFGFISLFCLLWTTTALVLSQGPQRLMFLFGFLMFARVCGFGRFGYWLSRNDIRFIETEIRLALCREDAESGKDGHC